MQPLKNAFQNVWLLMTLNGISNRVLEHVIEHGAPGHFTVRRTLILCNSPYGPYARGIDAIWK